MNARQAAREAAPALAQAGIPDAGFEAEVLVRAAGGLSRAEYFAGKELGERELARFQELLDRRMRREPATHILGVREFYGLEFEVTPQALVPRPETELLVDLALAELGRIQAQGNRPTVVDVGTGTGCVAVPVALLAPGARVVGLDVSLAALAVARRNRERHHAAVELVAGDLATPIARADIVVANLPYIPTDEIRQLEPEVRDYEPILALDGGPDGLALIRRLIDDCGRRLRPRLLALEVAYGQSRAVEAYAHQAGAATEIWKDLSGIERVVCARWG